VSFSLPRNGATRTQKEFQLRIASPGNTHTWWTRTGPPVLFVGACKRVGRHLEVASNLSRSGNNYGKIPRRSSSASEFGHGDHSGDIAYLISLYRFLACSFDKLLLALKFLQTTLGTIRSDTLYAARTRPGQALRRNEFEVLIHALPGHSLNRGPSDRKTSWRAFTHRWAFLSGNKHVCFSPFLASTFQGEDVGPRN